MAMMKQFSAAATSLDGFQIKTTMSDHELILDQSKEQGGRNEGPNSLELLLASLAGCIISVAKIVAHQKQIQMRGIHVEVSGEINYDQVMGKSDEEFPGFSNIRVEIRIDSDQSLEDKRLFAEEIETRCPVTNTFRGETEVNVDVT